MLSVEKKKTLSKKKRKDDERGCIFCQSASAEPYIRRSAQALGWKEAPMLSDKFHVKFDVLDENVKVGPNQLYNHFADNR